MHEGIVGTLNGHEFTVHAHRALVKQLLSAVKPETGGILRGKLAELLNLEAIFHYSLQGYFYLARLKEPENHRKGAKNFYFSALPTTVKVEQRQ